MKRIATVCTQYGYAGGTARVTTELMERFARDGYEVDVYCAKADDDILAHTKVHAVQLLSLTKIGLLQHWHLIVKSHRALKGKAYDLVYAAGALCLNANLITVHMLIAERRHSLDALEKRGLYHQGYSPLKRWLRKIYSPLIYELPEKWIYRNPHTKYVCVSEREESSFEQAFPMGHGTVIPNGVDTELMKPDPKAREAVRERYGVSSQEPLFCFVGSEWGHKGLDVAIRIVARHPEAKLVIVGKEQDRTPYLEQARALGCENRLIFAGFSAHVEQFYAAADFMIFPTCYETFGLVVLEAMAAELVVFSTRVYGIEDYIQNGVNGFVVDVGQWDEMEKQVSYALTHFEEMKSLRAAARETAVEMDWEQVYQQYKKVFDCQT
ncbi:MAG: glycosyltransferase family 4 protein [Eubacteriales bacterium]|nr:glycosyltransferase family 4 protein [Eubacteriales bacterium]